MSLNLQTISAAYPKVNVGQVLNICSRYGVVYIMNPKAGCSTIKLMLCKAHTGDYSLDPYNIHQAQILPRPADVGWESVLNMIAGDAYRFTFSRDPLARVVSAYSDKIVREKDHYSGNIQKQLGRAADPEDPVTFEDFLTALETQDPHDMDPHWRPQYINIMHSIVAYDFIGRLESFDADIAKVKRDAGLPDVPMVHRNKQDREVDIDGRLDLIRRIERIYAKDFELFGY